MTPSCSSCYGRWLRGLKHSGQNWQGQNTTLTLCYGIQIEPTTVQLWRALMNLRPKLLPLLSWNLGNGSICSAFGQPWFPEAIQLLPNSAGQKRLLVSDLINEDGSGWNLEELINNFGYEACMKILHCVKPPTSQGPKDRLIFTAATNGKFSVKKTYDFCMGFHSDRNPATLKLWEGVWKKGDVLPRLRVFLWKLLSNALPLTVTLAVPGIGRGDNCCMCLEGQEDAFHLIFACHFARRCWSGAPIPIRSDRLSGSIQEILGQMIDSTTPEQWTMCVNVMWAIWRCRNDKLYAGKKPTAMAFQRYRNAIQNELRLLLFRPNLSENM